MMNQKGPDQQEGVEDSGPDSPSGTSQNESAPELSGAASDSSEGDEKEETGESITWLRPLFRVLFGLLLLLLLLRIFVLAPFGVPTRSMYPTIYDGDVIVANKLAYNIRTPSHLPFTTIPIPHLDLHGLSSLQRGDIVVFNTPEPGRRSGASWLVKRCVAIPGDTVQLVDGLIYVNGQPPPIPTDLSPTDSIYYQQQPMESAVASPLLRDLPRLIIPAKGDIIQLPDSLSAEAWRSTLEMEGILLEYRSGIIFLNGRPSTRYILKDDYFFAMGDNSIDSRDSRYFGLVPRSSLVGRPFLIYWSKSEEEGIRWERMGKSLR